MSGEIHAEHALVPPGEVSIVDAHYGGPRPEKPARAARPRTQSEKDFLAFGPVAEAFLTGAAAAGVTKLSSEIVEVLDLGAAHGTDVLLAALGRVVEFSRWRAGDVRSILATNGRAPTPRPAGDAFDDGIVLTLPTVPTRSLRPTRSMAEPGRPIAVSRHDRRFAATVGSGPDRRAQTAQDGRAAPDRTRAPRDREDPTLEP